MGTLGARRRTRRSWKRKRRRLKWTQEMWTKDNYCVWKLQGVDNIYVVLAKFPQLAMPAEKADLEVRLTALVNEVHWTTGLEAWRRLSGNPNDLSLEDFFCRKDGASGDSAKVPKFRVTCNRSGTTHKFTSMEAAAIFGGAINDTFHWGVDMKNFDIEVVLNISEEQVYVCLGITRGSLHHRNLDQFGPTSLRCTIAYSMLRLCEIKKGDIVCDPMCGGGSIPIEAAVNWPDTFVLCGDNHHLATERTHANLTALNAKRKDANRNCALADLEQWDVCHLPLRNGSVDVFISDLPFGKRMGSRPDNRTLYPRLLTEIGRVCTPGTGRAILLTQDKKTLSVSVGKCSYLWRQTRAYGANIGGLAAAIFILKRTNNSAR
ncbi:tRNA (guanine(6)-N2)-methyltransferase THUMP3-like isoform X2 [Ornithodoros turicata]|uniref:tRNA (guanine(6)-N2)-methyltransferase THUMP3-like isoform X2 n=1 Tax=Ornithodoros turicata TaxID=34597 RepID=UPI003139060F